MKCQILFSGKNKKNTINLSSVELAQREVKFKLQEYFHQSCKSNKQTSATEQVYKISKSPGKYFL